MTASAEQAAATPGSQRRMPDFFIVGHAKSGTSALYDALRAQPGIFMPVLKEPWFFSRNNPQPQDTAERSVEFTGRRAMTSEEYLALFAEARPDQLTGEASTSYLWSPVAARAIASAQPSARIIAVLREPASFLRSLHLQLLTNTTEEVKDLRKAIGLDDARRAGREIPRHAFWPQALIYSDRVRYVEQLRRYDAVFPPEQMLVLVYDDFRNDNEATVRRVLRFLDVQDAAPITVNEVNTSTRRVRSARLNNLQRAVRQGNSPLAAGVKKTVETVMSKEARRKLLYPIKRGVLYGSPNPPDEQLMLELRRRFKGEVEALSEYLDRDMVALWGYDRLG
jgi:hypothetical protein